METRSEWVDYAKAFGIILVVYGHVARGLYVAGINIPESFFVYTDSIIYSFHMPLFFFLSGLFLLQSLKAKGAGRLVFSKVDTIVYPYVVWSLLQGSIEVLLAQYTNGNVSYPEVLALFWMPRAQFWFLYALFALFLIGSAIFSLVSYRVILPIFAVTVVFYLFRSVLPSSLILTLISNHLVYFIFGVVFHFYQLEKKLSQGNSLLFLAAAFGLAHYIFHFELDLTYSDKGIEAFFLALVSILFVVSLSLYVSKGPMKFLIKVGYYSLPIFLMHVLAGAGTRVILKSVAGVEAYQLHLIFGVGVGLAAPMIAVYLIEKLKIPFIFSAPISRLLKERVRFNSR